MWPSRASMWSEAMRTLKLPERRRTKALMPVLSPCASTMETEQMECYNSNALDDQRNFVWHMVDALFQSEEEDVEKWKSIPLAVEEENTAKGKCIPLEVELELVLNSEGIPQAGGRRQRELVDMQ